MKRSPLTLVVAGLISLGMTLPAIAQTYNGAQLQGHVTYVPPGTALDSVLTSPIDSAIAKPGDSFQAKLYAPVVIGSDVALPANTILDGIVTAADKSGHAGINGKMNLRLIGATTPDGTRYPLSAVISTKQSDMPQDKDGNIKGASTKSTIAHGALRTAAWTAGGTVLGICFAPIVGGAVGAGAIAGVATGGAVGLGSNLWRKGHDVKVASGTRIQFQLDQAMSLGSSMASMPNYTR